MNPIIEKLLEPQSIAWLAGGGITIGAACLIQWLLFRSPVTVLAHRAFMEVKTSEAEDAKPEPVEHWFVKVRNRSRSRNVVISHVGFWTDRDRGRGYSTGYIPITARQLPVLVPPGATWETFIPCAALPKRADKELERNFAVWLSGHCGCFWSRPNRNVPPAGFVESPV